MTASELGPAAVPPPVRGSSRRRWPLRGLRLVPERAPEVVGPLEFLPLMPSEEWFCGRVRHLAFVYREAGLSDPVLAAVLDTVREGWAPAEPLLRTLWLQAGQRPAGRVW